MKPFIQPAAFAWHRLWGGICLVLVGGGLAVAVIVLGVWVVIPAAFALVCLVVGLRFRWRAVALASDLSVMLVAFANGASGRGKRYSQLLQSPRKLKPKGASTAQTGQLTDTDPPTVNKPGGGAGPPTNAPFREGKRPTQEQDLRFERSLLEAQAEASPDGILVVSTTGEMISYNNRFVEMWQIPADILAMRSDEAALNAVKNQLADPDEFLRRVNHLYSHPDQKSRDEILLKDGRVFDRHSAPVIDRNGTHYGRVWFFRDVSDQKAAQQTHEHLAQIVRSSGEAIFATTADGLVTSFNATAEELYGYTEHEILGRYLGVLLPGGPNHDRIALLDRIRRGERVDRYETKHRRKDGALIDVALTVAPIRNWRAELIGASCIAHDIGQRKRSESRQHFLAQGSALFESLPDRSSRLAVFAGLFAPGLADVCIVHLLGSRGRIEHYAVRAHDPTIEDKVRELQKRYPIDPDSGHPIARVLRTGRSELVNEMSDSVRAQFVCDAEHLKLLHEINARQTLYVPLKARGRTIGALSLALLYDRYANAEDQLALVEELAGRAALALDNAELYEQQRTVAQALQQSLLPATLPTLEGFDIASRYRSAGEGNVVGGDFYDVFETSHGWAIIIGDVSGKGPEAASVTALARYTLQAAAMHGGGPSQALEALNATLLRAHGGKRFCTVVFCELARSEPHATLRLAAAGHPPPLLLRKDCSVDQLAADGGLPLGLWPNIEIRDHKVQLSAEDIVLFYTDGLTDARAPEIIFSADDIASLMLTCAGLDAQATAARLEQAVLLPHTDAIRDDMAIVTLKVLTADGKS